MFDQKVVVVRDVVIKTVAYYAKIGPTKKHKYKREIRYKDIWKDLPAEFFDGACLQRKCGCGAFIVLGPGIYYYFGWEGGYGTTTGQK